MMFDTTSSAMPHIKSGKFRPLAVTSPQRSAELPNVPTIAEAGYPAAEMTTWYGLFVTGGTPKPIVDKLHAELAARAEAARRAGEAQGPRRRAGHADDRAVRGDEPEGIRPLRRADQVGQHQGRVSLEPTRSNMMTRPRIALLPGDPNGIGPELAAKLLARPANVEPPTSIVFADPATIAAGERVAEREGAASATPGMVGSATLNALDARRRARRSRRARRPRPAAAPR